MVENRIVIVIPQFLLRVLCESDFFSTNECENSYNCVFSLDLYSLSNRSGNCSPALLLNLFWRSDITQFPTSATQTHGVSTLWVEENRKGFQRVLRPGLDITALPLLG